MKSKIKAALCCCLLFSSPVFSQQPTDSLFIEVLNNLRNDLFTHEKTGIAELKGLMERLTAHGLTLTDQQYFFINTWFGYAVTASSPKYTRKQLKKHGYKAADFYEDADLDIVKKNERLIDLLNQEVLKWEYPFPLNQANPLFEELRQYHFRNGMRIAEIGAGSGLISLLVASVYDNLEIYVNEKDPFLVDYINRQMSRFPLLRPSNKLWVLKGKKRSTALEGRNLDLIFIRDSFHHFSKKEEMIASLRLSLSDSGAVFVVEEVLEDFKDTPPTCSEIIKKSDILALFEKGGFLLVNSSKNGSDHILEFKKSTL